MDKDELVKDIYLENFDLLIGGFVNLRQLLCCVR
jgi:hypothetical protein